MRDEPRLEAGRPSRRAIGPFPVQEQGRQAPERMYSQAHDGRSGPAETGGAEPGQPPADADVLKQLEAYRAMLDARDALVRRARDAGLSEAQIAKATGHSRTTVRNILARTN
ncbi:hypothetical protein [Streptomyces erythrochromogenes]|uniref:hypothetical protein n=1 Tax=Streptomyces erythrochromogenes TaxID=285574 RepID=UPI0036C92263